MGDGIVEYLEQKKRKVRITQPDGYTYEVEKNLDQWFAWKDRHEAKKDLDQWTPMEAFSKELPIL